MRKLLAFLICAVVACSSSSSSSSSSDSSDSSETVPLKSVPAVSVIPATTEITEVTEILPESDSRIRQRQHSQPPPSLLNPNKIHKSHSLEVSADFDARPLRLPHQLSFAHFRPLVVFDAPPVQEVYLAPPRSSAIVKLLTEMDELMADQFTPVEAPKSLMAGHVEALNSICSRFINLYGPIHPFYRNCAFRSLELQTFLNLLTKYNTEIETHFRKSTKSREAFCSKFIPKLRKLSSLVSVAEYEFARKLRYTPTDIKFIRAALKPFAAELKGLENAIDFADWDLTEYCRSGASLKNETLDTVKAVLSKFLKLAFY